MLTLEQQKGIVDELPEVIPSHCGWMGTDGMTHIRLAAANEDVMAGALPNGVETEVEKNAKVGQENQRQGKEDAGSEDPRQEALTR